MRYTFAVVRRGVVPTPHGYGCMGLILNELSAHTCIRGNWSMLAHSTLALRRGNVKTALEWSKECTYISDQTQQVKAGFPGKEFNYDTNCFRRYCLIQKALSKRQGFLDSAEYIQHCLDDIERLS